MGKIQEAISEEGEADAAVTMPYVEEMAALSTEKRLARRTGTTPASAEGEGKPDDGGVVRRANEYRGRFGPVALEALAINGQDIRKAVETRADELYRNKFPVFEPRFASKCTECGAEYDEAREECPACGGPTREPDPTQRTEAEEFFREVNREGQSLHGLYRQLAGDGGRLGVWTHVVRYNYGVLRGAVFQEAKELVRADPKRLKPVVDENGRLGGHWWACPVHRDPENISEEPGECPECGADLRDVHYAEVEDPGDSSEPVRVYFRDEVISYADFTPLLEGHDGVSPVSALWLDQSILWWMNVYAAGFYDQENTDRYPGKLLVVHTSNKQAVEKQLDRAKDKQNEDPYAHGVLYNEVPSGGDGSSDSAQVVDMMSDKMVGQSDKKRKDLKSNIRSFYGLTDAQDSELEDSSGLNDEGLQLEISDRDKAKTHQRMRDGPLRKLMDCLGYGDWAIRFVPPEREGEGMTQMDVVNAASSAEQAGLAYEIEDGRFRVADTDGVRDPSEDEDDALGGAPAPPGAAQADVPEGVDAARTLEQAFRHMMWPDDTGLEQQAEEPFFADDADVPSFVMGLVSDAIDEARDFIAESDKPVDPDEAAGFLEEKLSQPQGWSLRSITSDFAERFGITEDEADELARPAVAETLNTAREMGYSRQGDLDDRKFKWIGPDDDRTTDACEELKAETNPDYDGEPVGLPEMKRLIQEKQREYFPDYSGETSVHWNERHTFVEVF